MPGIEKWSETYQTFSEGNHDGVREPSDLVRFATVAYLTGRESESFQILERAHQTYHDRGELSEAARCAFWLGLMLMDSGESARGSGWFSRGERILSGHSGSSGYPESALFLISTGLQEFYGEKFSQAEQIFSRAASIGEKFHDMDLIALGRLGQGQAMVHQGKTSDGIRLLDETMVIVGSDRVHPVGSGIIFCAGIQTCRKIWELDRAHEWTSALNRWCEIHPDLVPFRGQCLVSRAEIIQYHGNWLKALHEARKATEVLTRPPGKPAAGDALFRQAEILRLLGQFEEAEACYKESARWGRNIQPGLALLRLSQGETDTAGVSIRNSLLEIRSPLKRAAILPAFVRIMLATRQINEAEEAVDELEHIVQLFNTPCLEAFALDSRGAVSMARTNFQEALDHFRSAMEIWQDLNLPYEMANTLELKGNTYRQLMDPDNATIAWSRSKWLYEQLGAIPDLERITRQLNQKKEINPYGLTLRELQILRQIVSGHTNKAIGSDLFISTRTVDRHVSNIFNKLKVSSRTEATAVAIRNNILV